MLCFRDWSAYLNGFGELSGEFWLGLTAIQSLALSVDQELLILLEEVEGARQILRAKYSTFHLGKYQDKNLKLFKITARGHEGTAGDPLEKFQGSMLLLLIARTSKSVLKKIFLFRNTVLHPRQRQ